MSISYAFPLVCLAVCWFCLALAWIQKQKEHSPNATKPRTSSRLTSWEEWNERYLPWNVKVLITGVLTGIVFLVLLFYS